MYKHGLKTHEKFSSKTEKKVIIGGDTDFCAERFGYKAGKNGISPSLFASSRMPHLFKTNIRHAEYCPLLNTTLLLTKAELFIWNTGANDFAFKTMVYEQCPRAQTAVIDGVNYLVFVGGNRITLYPEQGVYKYLFLSVSLGASVIHCGRIFAADGTDGFMLRWSGYDFNDWSEGVDKGGYLRLNPDLGKIVDMRVLDDKIVILREKGLTTLNVLGDSRHMRMDLCNKHCLPNVYANSSVICGGKLWINTQNGMYVYDGNTLSKAPFDEIMEGFTLTDPTVLDDRYIYYSAVRGDLNCLFEYDTETGGCTAFAKNCHYPFIIGSEMHAFANAYNYLQDFLPDAEDTNRVWVSKPVTFGAGKTAVLKSLTIEGSGNIKVETDCDGAKLLSSGAGKFVYAESAQSFTFKVTGAGSITSMTAEWEVRG